MLTYSWGFLSIHREPIQALAASPALFPVNDAKCLEKSAWGPYFHVQLFIWVLKKHLTQLTKHIQYLVQSIEYVEETRCPLTWHALLHSLMFINIPEH